MGNIGTADTSLLGLFSGQYAVWMFLALAVVAAAFGGTWGYYAALFICAVLALNVSGYKP